MRRPSLFLALASLVLAAAGRADPAYYPPKGSWDRLPPAELGMDPARLKDAVAYSEAHEYRGSRDVAVDLANTFGRHEPMWRLLGPTEPRGGMTGIVVRHGRVAAAWGDPDRVDMTHSVTKTFLTTVVGLAWADGRIRDLSEPVRLTLPGSGLFDAPHNAPITWEHLLRQTSDWSGTLWDIPDWADRPAKGSANGGRDRPLHDPGTFFKYNDVRVNLLALEALQVWRRPLPDVLRERVMDPIGASDTWHWEGYRNSWVEVDGKRMQSVTGGGHFGGGMFISAWDMARFGYLFLEHGRWAGRQVVPESWLALARSPGPENPGYGFANWYLNPHHRMLPSAPETCVCFIGNGANVIYVDWDDDLVAVVRWINLEDMDGFVGRVLSSLREPAPAAAPRL
jgi:CubicO group peptidase (beta-lactamase class C family)